MEYDDFLRSNEWKEKRKEIMNRCDGICERCECNKACEVHHKTYKFGRLPPNEYLQALCRSCHKFLHRKSWYDPSASSLAEVSDMVDRWISWG